MKFGIWTLILSVALLPASEAVAPNFAYADTATATSTGTSTATSTNCTTAGKAYGGATFSNCSNVDSQKTSQDDTEKLNDKGAQTSMMLGMMATAAGMGMIAAGMAMTPPNGGLIAAGAALVAAGMMGMQAAGKMAKNAGISGYNGDNLGNLASDTTPNNTAGSSIDAPPNGTDGIKIDPSLTRTGKPSALLDDFEQKTGISRDDFIAGLNSGQSAADMMAGNKKFGANGAAQKAIDAASSSSTPMGADEVMAKLGLSKDDMAALAKNSSMGSEDTAYGAGTGGSRSPASAGASAFDSSFLDGKAGANPGTVGGADASKGALSSDVQAALDRNGITNLTIFQMVHARYKTKVPMMFGDSGKKRGPSSSTADNPFANLGGEGAGKIEF